METISKKSRLDKQATVKIKVEIKAMQAKGNQADLLPILDNSSLRTKKKTSPIVHSGLLSPNSLK
jgi:hypothetical protein